MMSKCDFVDKLPDFLQDATNVYRTKNFIVKQKIAFKYDEATFDQIVSTDTFYFRTKKRDREYEYLLDFKKNIDGKRMKAAMSSRTYVF
jgi:hypothetical protein